MRSNVLQYLTDRVYGQTEFRDKTDLVSNNVYSLIKGYIHMYDIKVPDTFSLHPCGLYARRRLKHWDSNNNGSMHLDATCLKDVIEEWLKGPYLDKEYVSKNDLEHLVYRDYYTDPSFVEKLVKENGFYIQIYGWNGSLKRYLEDTLPSIKVNYNGVKGFTLYDATDLDNLILNWLEENDMLQEKREREGEER